MSLPWKRRSKTTLATVDEKGRREGNVAERDSYSTAQPIQTSRTAGVPTVSSASSIHVDDFGRQIQPGPAFILNGGSEGDYAASDDDDKEWRLMYGYTPLSTTLDLSIMQVDFIVTRCAQELRARGSDTPLVLSAMALDISLEGTSSLIRSYTHNIEDWAAGLYLAAPLDIGTFVKWGLARLVNDKGGRGFLSWDMYTEFKIGEKANAYPARYCADNLLPRLPKSSAHLLYTLLDLFSNLAAYSSKNGMTPRKLASLFSPYVFGLMDDKPFDDTYADWQRITDAFEHVLLSFIRGQKASGSLPTHLEKFIQGYPQILNIAYASGATSRVPRGGRVEEVTRVRRLTRFHSRNLIQTAGSWEVPHSPDWTLFFPKSSALASASTTPVKPIFTPFYRHLLNIRTTDLDDDEDEGEIQRYKSVVEKTWGEFGARGFKEVDQAKLEFDLSESARTAARAKHATLDWGSFASQGFGGRETFSATDLIFRPAITQTVQNWPASQAALDERLRKTEQMLPPFPYDTLPHEEGRILVDINFFEAWADVLVASGWARDELKESNWALVHWRARPRDGDLPKGRSTDSDDRTEERWVLVEEYVPREYRDELKDGKKKSSKRVSFLRSVRKKKEPIRLSAASYDSYPVSQPRTSLNNFGMRTVPETDTQQVDESVFSPGAGGGTKVLSLSNANLSTRPNTDYAPSVTSSTRVGHGHGSPLTDSQEDEQSVDIPADKADSSPSLPSKLSLQNLSPGIGGTLSSQAREPASVASAGRGPVGYQKPAAKGFLARISSRKAKTPRTSPYGYGHHTQVVDSRESRDLPQPPTIEHSRPGAMAPVNNSSSTPTANSSSSVSTPPPPPPPKPLAPPSPTSPHQRSSDYSSTAEPIPIGTDDAYDGIGEVDEVQEGTVLFRGSRAFPVDAGHLALADSEAAGVPPELATTLPSQHTIKRAAEPVRLLPRVPGSPSVSQSSRIPVSAQFVPAVTRPNRHESLPPSPKPDAEVPVDEEIHQRDPKFQSGASAYAGKSSRVSDLVGLYQNRDTDIRLTQYGFPGAPPALGQVPEQQ